MNSLSVLIIAIVMVTSVLSMKPSISKGPSPKRMKASPPKPKHQEGPVEKVLHYISDAVGQAFKPLDAHDEIADKNYHPTMEKSTSIPKLRKQHKSNPWTESDLADSFAADFNDRLATSDFVDFEEHALSHSFDVASHNPANDKASINKTVDDAEDESEEEEYGEEVFEQVNNKEDMATFVAHGAMQAFSKLDSPDHYTQETSPPFHTAGKTLSQLKKRSKQQRHHISSSSSSSQHNDQQ